MVEYDYEDEIVTVYRLGEHTCTIQLDHTKRNSIVRQRLKDKRITGKAKDIGLHEVGVLIESGWMEMAAAEAEN